MSPKPAHQPPDMDDPRLVAAVDMLGRTGAHEFQIRYSDEEKPLVWIACARWAKTWEAAAAMHPLRAVFRLCDQVIDGGVCQHCKRPTGFAPEIERMPLDVLVCWYQWDPSTAKFVRSCAGEKP